MDSMATFYSSPFSYSKHNHIQNQRFGYAKGLSGNNRNRIDVVHATRRNEWNNEGRELIVDENMVVLRKRIHEMKMLEKNYEAPEEWMAWEKQSYVGYCEFICKFVGFLQFGLMNSRPSLALAMLLLVTFSIPTSILMIAINFMETVNGSFHLG